VNSGRILLAICEKGAIETYDPPNRPTAEEIRNLCTELKDELETATFGDAMQRLVAALQLQYALGDHLSGVIEGETARLLNHLAGEFVGELSDDALDDNVRFVDVFTLSMSVSTKIFNLRFRLQGESQDRSLRLAPTAVSALLAARSASRYFLFDVKAGQFVATNELLP
jgi:hypothetical protein